MKTSKINEVSTKLKQLFPNISVNENLVPQHVKAIAYKNVVLSCTKAYFIYASKPSDNNKQLQEFFFRAFGKNVECIIPLEENDFLRPPRGTYSDANKVTYVVVVSLITKENPNERCNTKFCRVIRTTLKTTLTVILIIIIFLFTLFLLHTVSQLK